MIQKQIATEGRSLMIMSTSIRRRETTTEILRISLNSAIANMWLVTNRGLECKKIMAAST
jgi:hypothetical protein